MSKSDLVIKAQLEAKTRLIANSGSPHPDKWWDVFGGLSRIQRTVKAFVDGSMFGYDYCHTEIERLKDLNAARKDAIINAVGVAAGGGTVQEIYDILLPVSGLEFAVVCTRPQHPTSPCNGLPRPDCPGYENWKASQ